MAESWKSASIWHTKGQGMASILFLGQKHSSELEEKSRSQEVRVCGPRGAWRGFNTIAAPCTPAANRYVSFCVRSMSLIVDSER